MRRTREKSVKFLQYVSRKSRELETLAAGSAGSNYGFKPISLKRRQMLRSHGKRVQSLVASSARPNIKGEFFAAIRVNQMQRRLAVAPAHLRVFQTITGRSQRAYIRQCKARGELFNLRRIRTPAPRLMLHYFQAMVQRRIYIDTRNRPKGPISQKCREQDCRSRGRESPGTQRRNASTDRAFNRGSIGQF